VASSQDGPADIDLVAASLRADATDVGTFTESLAAKLEELLPGAVRVHRWRTRVLGHKVVRKIVVQTGSERLELVRSEGDQIEFRRARMSGGIVLKTEPLGVDAWLEELGAAVSAEARRSRQTRQALERLLIQ
jgi:hypothetical protein